MRWFRSHRLSVASLALFALACQFVLAFGHTHLIHFTGNSSDWAVAAAAGKAVAAATPRMTSADLPSPPRHNGPSRLGDDFCVICASIGLADALVVPVAPAVPPEIASFKELRWSFAATQAPSVGRFHFSPRGPPRAA